MPFNIFIIETKCNYFNHINRLGAAQLDIFSLILLFFNGSIYFYFSFSAKFKKIHLPFAHFQFIYRVWMTRRRKKNWEKKNNEWAKCLAIHQSNVSNLTSWLVPLFVFFHLFLQHSKTLSFSTSVYHIYTNRRVLQFKYFKSPRE